MSTFFYINNVALPAPDKGLKFTRSQLVDSGRNTNGEIIAQKINRRLFKVENLIWHKLTAAQWRTILIEIEKFEGTLKFWDVLTNGWVTTRVYWGDSSETPLEANSDGSVKTYTNCQCNIIDMGFAKTPV